MEKIKQWLLGHKALLLTAIMVFAIPLSAFAATPLTSEAIKTIKDNQGNYKYYTVVPRSGNDSQFYVAYTNYPFKYTGNDNSLSLDSSYDFMGLVVDTSGSVYSTSFSSTSTLGFNGVVLGSNYNIVNSVTGDVFFSPPWTLKQGMEIVPETVVKTLTTGGLLGLGLTILAIGLGVLLVPRLVRSFNPFKA